MVNAQRWLESQEEYNTKEKRSEITELIINNKELEGSLNLNDFINLKKLDCSSNQFTNLNLPTNHHLGLVEMNCSNNWLTSLDFSVLNPEKLKELDISNNNFSESNLSIFAPFVNLEIMKIGNDCYWWDSGWRKEKIENSIYNRFMGSLDYLSKMKNLKELDISNTDLNEINIDKLPQSLWRIKYSTEFRPDWKLTEIVLEFDKYFGKFGRCLKCLLAKTSQNWCQPCAEQEWQEGLKHLTEQELIKKFIQQRKRRPSANYYQTWWIPYEEITNIEQIAEGGFSKIYKAKWKRGWYGENVVLKSLTNSQNITVEFLTEFVNTDLVDGYSTIMKLYGISQDPETGNFVMVMNYVAEGSLRQVLQNKSGRLDLGNKLKRLSCISHGLKIIHEQNLIHRDFHSGNILSRDDRSYITTSITDLGLCRPANHQKQEGQIFGVFPYVAPEVLQGQPYTQKSDIYGFGIIAYELLANAYPYPAMDERDLILKICQGLRPNIDELKIPQLLKNLVKRCWNANPEKRPDAKELYNIVGNWVGNWGEIEKNTPLYQQYQAIKEEYNNFSQNTLYQIHSSAITHSKAINTKEIVALLQNPSELAKKFRDLQVKNKKLREENWEYKNFTRPIILNNSTDFEEKYQVLKKQFGSLIKIKTQELNEITTKELAEKVEKEVSELKKEKEKLEQVYQKIEKEKISLGKLKNNILAAKPKAKDDLEELLEANNDKWIEKCKKRLIKRGILMENIIDLCEKQKTITRLKNGFIQQGEKIEQIINNYNYGATFANSTLTFTGGQNILGGKNESINQYNALQEIPTKK